MPEPFAIELGTRLIEDADKLRLFIPDHIAKFPFVYCGRRYEVTLVMEPEQ